ncbi:HNH endonuclease [Pseudoalteromonas sp. SCSIO 43201]|uniref:HNH endonuclease signature motif containing protein n=1 Tax=Pseudoalteromonas sp. SCSIO 43201 TaxID=2822842 RepID=UPI0020757D04|nr:HNH endonuclease signature motif containing protein [Pseudoalteromonas sp. SCSIO 43201]USD30919.1 HNH endonuclease [Pseudoalteromonas sp. SCSIO 43201]
MFVYSEEHRAFLERATKHFDMTGVAQQFNTHFGQNKTERQLLAIMQKHKISVVTKKPRDKKFNLTKEQQDWITERFDSTTINELRLGFMKQFESDFTQSQFINILRNLNFKKATPTTTKGQFKFQLSNDQVSWLDSQYQTHTASALLNMFNVRYKLTLTLVQFKNVLAKHGIKNSAKLNKKVGYKVNKTAFKKGDPHCTAVPLGSERTENGYVLVKIKEPNVWQAKQRLVYEHHFGPLKEYEVVRFKDGDKRNFSPENLFKTTRKGHGFLSKYQLLSQPQQIQDSLLILTQVRDKLDEVKCKPYLR